MRSLFRTSIVLLSMLVVSVPIFGQYQNQLVNVEGTLGLESFDPLCLKATPPCLQPSLSAPVLVAENSIFLLKSNDSTISQKLVSDTGSGVKISGFREPFNATSVLGSYSCKPYDCKRIESQITVTTLEIQSQHNTLPLSYLALSIALVAIIVLTIALVIFVEKRRQRSSTKSQPSSNSYTKASR